MKYKKILQSLNKNDKHVILALHSPMHFEDILANVNITRKQLTTSINKLKQLGIIREKR